jgi:hypothetical protein
LTLNETLRSATLTHNHHTHNHIAPSMSYFATYDTRYVIHATLSNGDVFKAPEYYDIDNVKKECDWDDIVEITFKTCEWPTELPPNLRVLELGDPGENTKLPPLPNSLEILCCHCVVDTSLEVLPPKLKALSLTGARVDVFPDMPDTLKILELFDCTIYKLPKFPTSLHTLTLSSSRIWKFSNAELPDGITDMVCSYMDLMKLPKLPSSLARLNCAGNKLQELPELPESLEELNCYNNSISRVDALPSSLVRFECSNNQIWRLPRKLPGSLERLSCAYNRLERLPEFPPMLHTVNFPGNPVELTLRQVNHINRIEEFEETCVYNNNQNVHSASVSDSLMSSVAALMR